MAHFTCHLSLSLSPLYFDKLPIIIIVDVLSLSLYIFQTIYFINFLPSRALAYRLSFTTSGHFHTGIRTCVQWRVTEVEDEKEQECEREIFLSFTDFLSLS